MKSFRITPKSREVMNDLWIESKGDLVALARVVIPAASFLVVGLLLWLTVGPVLVTSLGGFVVRSYRERPTETVETLGAIVILVMTVRYALRRTALIRASRNWHTTQRAAIGTAMRATDDGFSLVDPMPVEMQAVAKKHGRAIARVAIAQSYPGDALEEIMARAEELKRQQTSPLTLIGIARHEAAHALAAHFMGGTVISAEVYDIQRGGNTHWNHSGLLEAPQNFAWCTMVSSVAGHLIDHEGGRTNNGSHSDLRMLDQEIYSVLSIGVRPDGFNGEMNASGLIIGAREKARSILADHHVLYERLADELLRSHRLNSHQIRNILGNHKSPQVASGWVPTTGALCPDNCRHECGECRFGLGSHLACDPRCHHHVSADQ